MTEITEPRRGLYLVSRTSNYGIDKPCDEAFEIVITNIDTRTCDDPKKIPINKGTDGDWYKRGTNHRVENGEIKRDMGVEKVWAAQIGDLQEFVNKYGDCVISPIKDGFCSIEIYDDYRE